MRAYGGRAPTTGGVLEPHDRWVSAVGAVNLSVSAWVVAMRGGVVRRRLPGDRTMRAWRGSQRLRWPGTSSRTWPFATPLNDGHEPQTHSVDSQPVERPAS